MLPILAAFGLIFYFVQTENSDTVLKGTWKVEQLTRNGRVVPANAWLTDTTAWNRVYFAGWQGCAFSPNPYRYRPGESLKGKYEFDSLTINIRLMLSQSDKQKVSDAPRTTLIGRTHKVMRLRGILGRDTLDMQLARLR